MLFQWTSQYNHETNGESQTIHYNFSPIDITETRTEGLRRDRKSQEFFPIFTPKGDIDFVGQDFRGYLDLQCIFAQVLFLSSGIPHIPYNTNIWMKVIFHIFLTVNTNIVFKPFIGM